MKKKTKILLLYLLVGIIVSVIFSFAGGYDSLMIHTTIATLSKIQYFIFMVIMVLLWLPIFIVGICIGNNYWASPLYKVFFAVVIVIFVILSICIIAKRKNKEKEPKE